MAKHLNVEIKAKCSSPELIHDYLKSSNAEYKGLDHQVDTYFNCPEGRMKLRSGNIENSLIFYKRSNQAGPKESDITMTKFEKNSDIGKVLESCYGIKKIVDKQRHIYFIDNVKFHVDEVKNLGSFVEIEAIDIDGSLGLKKITSQCEHYLKELNILPEALVEDSYSDLL